MHGTAKGEHRDPFLSPQVTRCDLRPRRQHLKAAMDRLGIEANHIALDWGCHYSYVGRVLSGEKPWPELKVALLSFDLRVAMAEEECKDLGLVTGPRAALIGALESLAQLAGWAERAELPSRSSGQAKATLDAPATQKVTA